MDWQPGPGGAGAEPGPGVPGGGPGSPPGRDPRLALFAAGGAQDPPAPSGRLALLAEELSGPGRDCPGATDEEMTGLARAWAAIESWAAAGKLGTVREMTRREAAGGTGWQGGPGDGWPSSLRHELALALACSPQSAETVMWLARELAARLPGTGALLGDGTLTAGKARAVAETFRYLTGAGAAAAEALILGQVAGKTYAQVLRLAGRAALTVDPELAERRREQAQKRDARVSFFREQAGTAGLCGRDLPPDEALAAIAAVNARAELYKESGAFGGAGMDLLRAYAFLDRLNGVAAEERVACAVAQDEAAEAAEALAWAQARAAAEAEAEAQAKAEARARDEARARAAAGAKERAAAGRDRGAPAGPGGCGCGECDGTCLARDDLPEDDLPGGGLQDEGYPGGGFPGPAGHGGPGASDGAGTGSGAHGSPRDGRDPAGNDHPAGCSGPVGHGTDGSHGDDARGEDAGRRGDDDRGDGDDEPGDDAPGDGDSDSHGDGTREDHGGGHGDDDAEPGDAEPGDGGDGDSGDDGPGPGGPGPGPAGPGPGGPGPRPGAPPAGLAAPPRPADLTVPLATLLGLAERPGEAHGLGPLDPALARDLAAAAAASPRTEICVTVTSPEGYATGHGCARPRPTASPSRAGRAPRQAPPPGTAAPLAGLPARLHLTIPATTLADLATRAGPAGPASPASRASPAGPASRAGPWALAPSAPPGSQATPGPPGGRGTWTLTIPGGRQLTVRLDPVPTYDCDHRHESRGYQPNGKLRHLVQVRDGTCTCPVCNRHARDSDFEHALPYHQGGRTCACNAGARSRACHKVKQSPGWKVTQPRPGWHQWQTPTGRTYTQEPWRYPA